MSAPADGWKYLEPNPDSLYRQLWVKGRRIRARTLYGALFETEPPRTPEQVAEDYNLPVEAVWEAIAYCESNPPELRADQEDEERLAEATGMNDPEYRQGGKYRLLSPQERVRLGL